MQPKIEKGIPIPSKYPSRLAWVKSLKPGESFIANAVNEANYAVSFGKRNGFKMTSRKTEEGWRVWRVN